MRLTEQQQAVVQHGDGHARVAAVAGSGKTTTLVSRVLYLLEKGVPPERILVLMFNRAARDDFTTKLSRWAPSGQALPSVRTFHSIGHRLTRTLTRWGVLESRELLTADWQRQRLLRQAVMQVLDGDSATRDDALDDERVEALGQFCDLVKAEMAPPRVLYERLAFGTGTAHFVETFEAVESLLAQYGLMTYSDLLYRPLLALASDPDLQSRVQGFLDHVIIDEYQDINVVQQRLLAMLAGRQAQVMAVGDANQCIYEWRGAQPEAMLDNFTAAFGTARHYPLSWTFRHGHALALAANHAIAGNRRRPDQLCLAGPDTEATELRVECGELPLVDALEEWQRKGRSLKEACILVRSWSLSVSVQLTLLRAGISFHLNREDRFVFKLPLVQALAGYLMVARDRDKLNDPAHVKMLLEQPTPFVARERLAQLAERLVACQSWPESRDPLLADLKPVQRRNLKRRWQLLCDLPLMADWAPADLLRHIVKRLDAESVLKRAAARREKGEEDVRLLDVLIEQASQLADDPDAFIELLRRPVQNQAAGVHITTVHGAKGLEWPLVAIWGANEEDFPYFSRDNPLTDDRLEEERRLFYVAMTRARERLLMLHNGGSHRPSRFLEETAWQDCRSVARALQVSPQAPVPVSDPTIIERYLNMLGLSLSVVARQREKERSSRRGFVVGQRLQHAVFGEGQVVSIEGHPDDPVIEVSFTQAGRRRLVATRAPVTCLEEGEVS
ncbi:ATP-dependent helicase [Aidingimonas halophila]|uniref:DNA 3'-5' helicase n=1 Tax=Aidingimonas halophila TaxID=574349 RepID=A0A1H2QKT3_9GAMM|nr:ATP-dependent helicase [Aidingimonas halophila]GHC20618.1 DNA helicase [Aidingimonas halophila]SDW07817.1 DNA helicase-2 / ATP-dependent DNA helicase PcrA [Aidingimonas halophila]